MALISAGSKILQKESMLMKFLNNKVEAIHLHLQILPSQIPLTSPPFASLVQIQIGKCPRLCQKQLSNYMPKRVHLSIYSLKLTIHLELSTNQAARSDEKICSYAKPILQNTWN